MHTRLDAAFLDQPPSQSFEAASLQLKAFELGIGMAEQIFVCGNHRASHPNLRVSVIADWYLPL